MSLVYYQAISRDRSSSAETMMRVYICDRLRWRKKGAAEGDRQGEPNQGKRIENSRDEADV